MQYYKEIFRCVVGICCGKFVRQKLCIAIYRLQVSKDHVHLHIEYPPKNSVSDMVKAMKGRTSRLIQEEFPELKKRYWGRHFWATGYGVWSTGNITDDMIQQYLAH